MHKTSAWPLALVYTGLIVYASLYPFTDLRDQGIMPWAFLSAPWPKYWTWFDVTTNLLGYMPLGFLWALSQLRSGHGKHAAAFAALFGGALSLWMEGLQSYLPTRVSSQEDLLLNFAGAAVGAVFAAKLETWGAIDRWSQLRARWFVPDSRGALALLALWPIGLLFPPAVPLGMGQIYERLEKALANALAGTPFLEWMPLQTVELQPILPLTEVMCVCLGGLIPCLLAYSVVPSLRRRAVLALGVMLVGTGVSALSAALSYGPAHAWAWLGPAVQMGLGLALVLALVLVGVTRGVACALSLLALGVALSLLNRAPASAYYAQTLQSWEQGRFIRFHGLAQWVGWVWPYAAMAYLISVIASRDRATF